MHGGAGLGRFEMEMSLPAHHHEIAPMGSTQDIRGRVADILKHFGLHTRSRATLLELRENGLDAQMRIDDPRSVAFFLEAACS